MTDVSRNEIRPEPGRALSHRSAAVLVFIVLFAGAVALLAWRLGSRPDFAYNWEAYTLRGFFDFVHQPTDDVLTLRDGLMTDSGRSIAVIGPAWVGETLLGTSWLALRLPIALIAALAVPLTWLFGRLLYSDAVGLCGAALVATSPVFLLYGRTATLVGMSLAPALIGFIVLWLAIRPGDYRRWPPLAMLQMVLIINSYVYSPIRFLWLIAIIVFMIEWALRPGERVRFARATLVTVLVLPVALLYLRGGPLVSPDVAIERYYYGRGEQIFDLDERPSDFIVFLRPTTDEERQALAEESTDELALRLIRRNAEDLANLLLDRGTLPAITHYWNPDGRLYPSVLVPFFLLGVAIMTVRFLREPRARLLQALFWGFSLPLLLTSQVHIGRLIFVVPLLALICAVPIESAVRLVQRWRPFPSATRVALALAALVAVAGAVPNLRDWQTPFRPGRMVFVADRIEELAETVPEPQLVYVHGDLSGYEVEGLRVAELEMLLAGDIQVVDLLAADERGSGSIRLLYGGTAVLLSAPETIPGYCTNLYLVEPDQMERFVSASSQFGMATCGHDLVFNELDV